MGVSGVELGACILLALGTLLNVICVALPLWKRNDPQDTVLDSIYRHEGLWIKCQTFATGNWDCDDFDRFFIGLPTNLQAARGFGVTALVLGFAAIAALCTGMECMPCGGDDTRQKNRMKTAGGSMGIISGLVIIVACSWYANNVREQHDIATLQQRASGGGVTRFIFGEALFVGWAGGMLTLIGGLIALCTACGGGEEENTRGYVYRPPKSNSQEYV